jgi:hypothetical protein
MTTRLPRALVAFSLALALGVCGDGKRPIERLVEKSRAAATEKEWRAWAERVIERSKTNSAYLPSSEWPGFVRSVTDDDRNWHVDVWSAEYEGTNTTFVGLLAIGGFESIGVIIGPARYIEVTAPHDRTIATEVYPGIYVRKSQ